MTSTCLIVEMTTGILAFPEEIVHIYFRAEPLSSAVAWSFMWKRSKKKNATNLKVLLLMCYSRHSFGLSERKPTSNSKLYFPTDSVCLSVCLSLTWPIQVHLFMLIFFDLLVLIRDIFMFILPKLSHQAISQIINTMTNLMPLRYICCWRFNLILRINKSSQNPTPHNF